MNNLFPKKSSLQIETPPNQMYNSETFDLKTTFPNALKVY